MTKRIAAVGVSLAGLLILSSVASGQSVVPWSGTWKVNLAKSTWSPGPAPQSGTLTIEATGDGQKHTLDGVNAQGQPFHREYTFKFDGIPVTPVAVAPPPTTATAYSSKKVDDRSYDISTTVDGKPTVTSRLTIAADGRTINQAMSGTNPQGQTVKSALVWDKQ